MHASWLRVPASLFIIAFIVPVICTYSFVHISDIHYDPTATPTQWNSTWFCRPPGTNASFRREDTEFSRHNPQFDELLFNGQDGQFGRYGCDSPPSLLTATFNFLAHGEKVAKPNFVIFTGDHAAHQLTSEVQLSAIQYVAAGLQKVYAGVPIITTIGNNDVYPDYNATCSSPRYEALFAAYSNVIPSNQQSTYLAMGAYAVSPITGLRVISLNTLLWSNHNSEVVADPCGQFAWLSATLAAAQQAKEVVYIVGHVLPGLDSFLYALEWDAQYNTNYLNIMNQYSTIISGAFFGHIHRDEFRVFETSTNIYSSLLVGSSISPIFDNNPSVRMVYTDSAFNLVDYEQYVLDLLVANQYGVAQWMPEYSFRWTYKTKDLSTSSLIQLTQILENDTMLFDEWDVRRTGGYLDDRQLDLCALESPNEEVFIACVVNNQVAKTRSRRQHSINV